MDDRSETSQSTVHEIDSSVDQDIVTSDITNVTWTDLVDGKSSEIIETPLPMQRSSHESDSVCF